MQKDLERQRRIENGEREETILERVASLAGMRKMSDEEYVGVLSERALELEAEIALIDEKIEAVKTNDRREPKGDDKTQVSI